ncbi:hypothetical protein [Dyella japonica]|uniref:YD repeat-containing protein n=1 Tax=Dyella japonica TaxID=231455 RepID=A0ABV2K072_9GAMM
MGNAAHSYDANSNTTVNVIGGESFGYGYDGRNRLITVQRNGGTVDTYAYNANGERVAKIATWPSAINQRYVYGPASQLLGEYGGGAKDYVWLDNLPIAVA